MSFPRRQTAYQLELVSWVEALNKAKRYFTSENVKGFLDRLIQVCLDRYDEEDRRQ